MGDLPWPDLFGFEFMKAVMTSLFIGAAVFGALGFVAGAGCAWWVWG